MLPSKAEFSALLRHWYDGTEQKTIGDLDQVKGVATWVTVRTGGRDVRVHADTNRDGVRRYLDSSACTGQSCPGGWSEAAEKGNINKVCVEPDATPTKGLFIYTMEPLEEPGVI